MDIPVAIVGAGPAGIAVSLTLRARGVPHCLIEALDHPTFKPGESIPARALTLFRHLGLEPLLLHPRHKPYHGIKSCWDGTELHERDFLDEPYGPGYLLDRCFFEQQLRRQLSNENSRCTFWEGYALKQVKSLASGVEIRIAQGKTLQTFRAHYVVDATGRKASVCRQLGALRKEPDKQFALILKASAPHVFGQHILIEATRNGWWYAAPAAAQEWILMFFTLRSLMPDKAAQSGFLQGEWESTLHLKDLIPQPEIHSSHIQVMPAGTGYLSKPFGDNWIAVGDAAVSYDPVSSYGITSALAGGFYGGHAIADALSGQYEAFDTYRHIVETARLVYLEKLVDHYQNKRWPGSLYWATRFE